jgi:hypothetical protein
MENNDYFSNEYAFVFWGFMAFLAISCFLILRNRWIACKNVTLTPEQYDPQNEEDLFTENVTYIFKKPCGKMVKNDKDNILQFTHEDAKQYARHFPYYKVSVYCENLDNDWYSCSTYFL